MYSMYSIVRVVSEENRLFIFPRRMLTKRHLSKACLLPFFQTLKLRRPRDLEMSVTYISIVGCTIQIE